MRHFEETHSDGTVYLHSGGMRSGHKVKELTWSVYPRIPFVANQFSDDLAQFGTKSAVIADSNIYLADTSDRIWTTLFEQTDLLMVAPVQQEIEKWIEDPRGINLYAHGVVQEAKQCKNSLVSSFAIPEKSLVYVLEYYVNLLGVRSEYCETVREELREQYNKEPTSQEINDLVRKRLGSRSLRLALSRQKTKVDSHRYNDEAIVLHAIFYALLSGQQTIILTHDENVLEQFYKACWLIDTHWRSMLFARAHALKSHDFTPTINAIDAENDIQSKNQIAFSRDDTLFLTKPSASLHEILPIKRTLVPIHCCLIKEELSILAFGLVREMVEVLSVKAKAKGRNTDELGEKNCHITLGPLSLGIEHLAAIGTDRSIQKGPFSFAVVDLNLVLGSHEHFINVIETTDEPRQNLQCSQ